MQACGIVVEYNPLHSGHIHHIQESRTISGCDVLIAVMSPYFVQRGEPAILNPAERARQAILHGVDLVVELPYPYCLEHADKFAFGAIAVLNKLHIKHLCFGSESNDMQSLKQELERQFAQQFSSTNSLAAHNPHQNSNDILGVAYLKALRQTAIQPLTIQRTNVYRSTTIESMHASASALRQAVRANETTDLSLYTPMEAQLRNEPLADLATFYPLLRYLLTTLPTSYLKSLFLMDEGMEGLLQKQAVQCNDLASFLTACTSKRYTRSRIQRTLCHLLLQTTKEEAQTLEQMDIVRILAYNQTGQAYLKQVKKHEKEHQKLDPAYESPQFVNKFNQLPIQYQKKAMQLCRVAHHFSSEAMLHEAIQQELSYPIRLEV